MRITNTSCRSACSLSAEFAWLAMTVSIEQKYGKLVNGHARERVQYLCGRSKARSEGSPRNGRVFNTVRDASV